MPKAVDMQDQNARLVDELIDFNTFFGRTFLAFVVFI